LKNQKISRTVSTEGHGGGFSPTSRISGIIGMNGAEQLREAQKQCARDRYVGEDIPFVLRPFLLSGQLFICGVM
jgi:hypothetical protein